MTLKSYTDIEINMRVAVIVAVRVGVIVIISTIRDEKMRVVVSPNNGHHG